MEEEYIVREDITRILTAIVIYVLFIVGLGCIILFKNPPIWGGLLIAILITLLGVVVSINARKLLRRPAMYKFCNDGIYDYTKDNDLLFLTWNEILKIEMIANNSSLQIGILASKTLEEREEMSKQMKENLRENGNRVFYSIMMDGFQFKKKHFQEIYEKLKTYSQNTSIVFVDYEDPILKKKKR